MPSDFPRDRSENYFSHFHDRSSHDAEPTEPAIVWVLGIGQPIANLEIELDGELNLPGNAAQPSKQEYPKTFRRPLSSLLTRGFPFSSGRQAIGKHAVCCTSYY
jgi:hypothetical protein